MRALCARSEQTRESRQASREPIWLVPAYASPQAARASGAPHQALAMSTESRLFELTTLESGLTKLFQSSIAMCFQLAFARSAALQCRAHASRLS
eukprot:6210210-Pleurochrysis_carterae.AAC.1